MPKEPSADIRQVIEAAVGRPAGRVSAVSGGDIGHAYRVEFAEPPQVLFAKTVPDPPPGFFAAEARGLDLLAAVGDDGVPVPGVAAVTDDVIVLDWVESGSPSPERADDFGRRLAATHQAGYATFGLDVDRPAYIGSLPLLSRPWPTWTDMWADGRVLPYLRSAADQGSLDDSDRRDIEAVLDRLDDLVGPAEPPARIHGDLWSGNILWSATGPAHVIDPAAHGGHRETDLAMLALFGAPFLDRVLAAYHEVTPLADGWRDRVALHQLHPVLVHAVLFGGSYGSQAGTLARSLLSSSPPNAT